MRCCFFGAGRNNYSKNFRICSSLQANWLAKQLRHFWPQDFEQVDDCMHFRSQDFEQVDGCMITLLVGHWAGSAANCVTVCSGTENDT